MTKIEIILKELMLYRDEYMPEFQEALDDNAHQLDFSQFTRVRESPAVLCWKSLEQIGRASISRRGYTFPSEARNCGMGISFNLANFQVLDKLCGVTRVDASVRALRAAFDKIDKNRDGFISEDELRAAAPLLDIDVEDVKKMMKAADANKDGKVDFDEFRKMLGNTDSFNCNDEMDP